MSEIEIAETLVKPYLFNLGFSKDLVSDYDSVYVQFGTATGRVDFVAYFVKGEEKLPFLVVEVKKVISRTDRIQAESYAQRLNAPFFAVTDGKDWHWFLTGKGQANSLRLQNCPLPLLQDKDTSKHLAVNHRKDLIELVSLYQTKLESDTKKCPVNFKKCSFMDRPYYQCESCLVWNNCWLKWSLDQLTKFYANYQKMPAVDIIEVLGSGDVLWNVYPQNRRRIRDWIEKNLYQTREIISYLLNENNPVENRFDRLVSGDYHIPGIGSFIVTMLLAGINREKYSVISNRTLQGMLRLGLIELQPSNMTGIDYTNFNKILLKLSEKFRDEFGFGKTVLVHDFTLLIGNYLDTGRWRG
jgi:hypothetical protein